MGAGGGDQGGDPLAPVRASIEWLKGVFSRLGLDGGAVVASLVGSLVFAIVAAHILRGDS
jgi:hypothetical protein